MTKVYFGVIGSLATAVTIAMVMDSSSFYAMSIISKFSRTLYDEFLNFTTYTMRMQN